MPNENEREQTEKNEISPVEQAPETADEEETPETPEQKLAPAKEFLEWVELFAYSVVFVIVLFSFVLRIAVVNGPSMEKTLIDGEVLLVSDLFYEPTPGDIIVFQSNTILNNEPIVKRVIAKEGQVVDIDFDTWTVYVDGAALDETYVNFEEGVPMNASNYEYPMTVEPGKIFVMGDNRNHSTDSRSWMIGQVDTRFVLGKLICRLLPVGKFGAVD